MGFSTLKPWKCAHFMVALGKKDWGFRAYASKALLVSFPCRYKFKCVNTFSLGSFSFSGKLRFDLAIRTNSESASSETSSKVAYLCNALSNSSESILPVCFRYKIQDL